MLLPREFVTYLSRQIVQRITGTAIDTHAPERVIEIVDTLINDEMAAEDKLNDEVRDLLEEYSDYMRRESISYQDMFRKIKNTLVQKKKIVRASGRDTGDGMKLSRDKITDISHKLVVLLQEVPRPPPEERSERSAARYREGVHRYPSGGREGRPRVTR